MFLGEYTHTIDDKSRLTIPSKFREALSNGMVLTRGYEHYLVIYPAQTFAQLAQKVSRLSPSDPDNRLLFRLVFAGAHDANMDKAGRIIMPNFLRGYASLNAEVVLVGVGQYIELWDSQAWQAQLTQINNSEVNGSRFAALNLAADETP